AEGAARDKRPGTVDASDAVRRTYIPRVPVDRIVLCPGHVRDVRGQRPPGSVEVRPDVEQLVRLLLRKVIRVPIRLPDRPAIDSRTQLVAVAEGMSPSKREIRGVLRRN